MVYIIAEIAGAHECDVANAKLLAEAAKKAGADAIKHQIYDTDHLVVKTHPKYERYKEREFSLEQWEEIVDHANKLKIDVLFDLFDLPSYNKIKDVAVTGYKLPATVSEDVPLLKALSSSDKKIFLGVGGLSMEEIERAYGFISKHKDVVLLCGVQNSPTAIKDSQLKHVSALKQKFKIPVGYCEHSAPEGEWTHLTSNLALASGAEYLEKHICIERKEGGRGAHTSLTPEEFVEFVKIVREAETALGTDSFELTDSDFDYRHKHKKYLVAAHDVSKNSVLGEEDVVLKRVVSPAEVDFHYEDVVGKAKTTKDVKEDEQITKKNISF